MEEGKRFSQAYLERGKPTRDSQRFRKRLSAYASRYLNEFRTEIAAAMETECGFAVPWEAYGRDIAGVFERCELRDVLDSITLVYHHVRNRGRTPLAEDWLQFVARACEEENVGYRLDAKGGVRFFVDEEFERNRAATVAILEQTRYASARAEVEAAYKYLDAGDTKPAVRAIFEAIEILVKQMVSTTRLTRRVVETDLVEKCVAVMDGDQTAQTVTRGLFKSMSEWVDAIQFYRHGQVADAAVAPGLELAVQIVSQGTSYLRWLAEFDSRGDVRREN